MINWHIFLKFFDFIAHHTLSQLSYPFISIKSHLYFIHSFLHVNLRLKIDKFTVNCFWQAHQILLISKAISIHFPRGLIFHGKRLKKRKKTFPTGFNYEFCFRSSPKGPRQQWFNAMLVDSIRPSIINKSTTNKEEEKIEFNERKKSKDFHPLNFRHGIMNK